MPTIEELETAPDTSLEMGAGSTATLEDDGILSGQKFLLLEAGAATLELLL